jgi:hypothetical protein
MGLNILKIIPPPSQKRKKRRKKKQTHNTTYRQELINNPLITLNNNPLTILPTVTHVISHGFVACYI